MPIESVLDLPTVSDGMNDPEVFVSEATTREALLLAGIYELDASTISAPAQSLTLPFDDSTEISDRSGLYFKLLKIIGTPSDPFTVIHPDRNHSFLVWNTSGQTATIEAATVGDTVSVADGAIRELQCIDDTTNFDIVAIDGVGKKAIQIDVDDIIPRVTNGPAANKIETTTNNIILKTLDFDATTLESAQFKYQMPPSWDGGPVTALIVWSHAAATTFDVVWGIQAVGIGNDDALDVAFGTPVTVTDSGGTTDDEYIAPETGAITIANAAKGDTAVFEIYRDAANGSDTLDVDARLHHVVLYFNTDKLEDS